MLGNLDFSQLLIEAILEVLVLSGGFLLGWWLRRAAQEPRDRSDVDLARKTASRMGEVARGIRDKIDRHRKEMAATLKRMADQPGVDSEAVARGLRELIESNARLQRELDSAEEKLHEQALTIDDYAARVRTDTLTQVMNRGAFDEELSRRMAEWHRRARPFCAMMLDVDRFKSINDEHGHQAGDQVLQHVAQVLRGTIREMDLLARIGGDEFAVLLPDSNLAEAALAADRLRRQVEGLRAPVDGHSLSLTISLGVAEVLPADNEESVVSRADEALYAAKKAGRNRCCYHDGTQAATMPLGGMLQRPAMDHDGSESVSAELVEYRHPGYSAMLADLVCRVAECERTGNSLSILLIEIGQSRDHGLDGLKLGIQERLAIGECLLATLREMDKSMMLGSRLYGSILPGASEETAIAIAHRAAENIIALQSRSVVLRSATLLTSTATYRTGDAATSLLSRAEARLVKHVSAEPASEENR